MKSMLPTVEEIARNHGIASERARCAALVANLEERLSGHGKTAEAQDFLDKIRHLFTLLRRQIEQGDQT